MTPKEGEVVDNIQITMVPEATIAGRILLPDKSPAASQVLAATLIYADGARSDRAAKTDVNGAFTIKGDVSPGVIRVELESQDKRFTAANGRDRGQAR